LFAHPTSGANTVAITGDYNIFISCHAYSCTFTCSGNKNKFISSDIVTTCSGIYNTFIASIVSIISGDHNLVSGTVFAKTPDGNTYKKILISGEYNILNGCFFESTVDNITTTDVQYIINVTSTANYTTISNCNIHMTDGPWSNYNVANLTIDIIFIDASYCVVSGNTVRSNIKAGSSGKTTTVAGIITGVNSSYNIVIGNECYVSTSDTVSNITITGGTANTKTAVNLEI
jgi:hypothetical protein